MANPAVGNDGYEPYHTFAARLLYLHEGQEDVAGFFNLNLTRLQAELHIFAEQCDLNTPPGSPVDGDVYVLGTSPTGVWNGYGRHIAVWMDTNPLTGDEDEWLFTSPRTGMWAWCESSGQFYYFGGTNWATGPT